MNDAERKAVDDVGTGVNIIRIRTFLFPEEHDTQMVLVSSIHNRDKKLGKCFIERSDPKSWFNTETIIDQRLVASEDEMFNTHNKFIERMYKEVRPHAEVIQEEQEQKTI